MKHRTRLASIATLLAATLALVPAARAQLASKKTGGTLELQVVSGASFDRDKVLSIVFVWHPELESELAGYQVAAECSRRDRLGAPPDATNRISFELAMRAIESGQRYRLGRRSRKLGRDGLQVRTAAWNDVGLESIVADGREGGVLVRLDLSIRRGSLDLGDTLSCRCDVTETDPRGPSLDAGVEAVSMARR